MSTPNSEQGLLSKGTKLNLILLCIGFLLGVLIYLTESLTSVVVLLAATLLLSYLLLGPVHIIERQLNRIQRDGKPFFSLPMQRTLAIFIIYLLCFGMVILITLKVAPPFVTQAKEFAHDIPQYVTRLQTAMTSPVRNSNMWLLPKTVSGFHQQLLSTTSSHLMQKIMAAYGQYAARLGSYLLDIGTLALSGLIYGLTTLVLVFIVLQDGMQLKKGFVELLPNQVEYGVDQFLERFHRHSYHFIKSQAIMSLLAGSMIYLLLTLLDSKYALLLGVFYGVVSILPVIGPWLGLIALSGFILFGEHPGQIIAVVLYVGTFYTLKTYWLWPQMMTRPSDTHPVIFIITFLACLRIAGPLGVLLAFPISSLLGVTFDYLRELAAKESAISLDGSI